jgi:AraC family transcriptional regulator
MTTAQRLVKAIDYLEAHLDDDLSMTRASESACYSHYHFLRIFHALTGMTIGTYARRRRLTRAAEALVRDDTRIIEIAQDAGFDSQASFSRAFKSMFGETPARFRRSENISSYRGQPVMTEAYLHHLLTGGVTMNPRFEHREAFTVIGIGKDYALSDPSTIPALWDNFLRQKHLIPNVQGMEAYGVCYGPKEKETFSDRFHYAAALRVHDDAVVPEGMEKIHLRAQEYAVFTHRGPASDIMKTNVFIWKTWVPSSGVDPVDAPDFEVYGASWNGSTTDGEMEIWVPVVR